ncbi:unnamed protein product [Rhodiola kirilowii]
MANMTAGGGITFTKQLYMEDKDAERIKSIQFSTLSEAEILKGAVVEVWDSGLYDSTTRKPKENALLDPRMGPTRNNICATCHGNHTNCPGHYGYLTLVLPIYNIGYLGNILNILKCICKSCSRILLEETLRRDFLKKMRNPRTETSRKNELVKQIVKKCTAMAASRKSVECPRCRYVNGTMKKDIPFGIVHDRSKIADDYLDECKLAMAEPKESKTSFIPNNVLDPAKVLYLLQNMSFEDCELLYLSERPEKYIIKSIPVPPVSLRPSVTVDGGRTNESDITMRLRSIITVNASLCQALAEKSDSHIILEHWLILQAEVALYINSDNEKIQKMVENPSLSGFVQRLKGKQGRFRGNLSGKRVEFTGRTVISPDPNLKISEVAIPVLMAKKLSYPEKVHRQNIAKLKQRIMNGTDKYPGASKVEYADSSSRMLLQANFRKRCADELEIGSIVHRHLEDGDIVLFNRQPSLHRMSIMCHRARVLPWRTLRFNESVCNPYNADFDGDEMNMHVPQTEEARTEALMLMGVQNNLCTPKNGEILVASTQDFLTSAYLITRKDTFYDRAAFSLMCAYMGDGVDLVDLPTPSIIKPMELWTGKQLFSVLLRPEAGTKVYLNLTVRERGYRNDQNKETMCSNDRFVYIRNSELLSGQLGKATLGNGNKDGLYSVLLRDYNMHAASYCMNRLAKLSARWIGNHGFSIGIDDIRPGEELNNKKKEKVAEGYKACDDLVEQYNKGALEVETGADAAQSLELKITKNLNDIRDTAAKVCIRELHWRNSPLIMYQCGSKGSDANICQMIACVGQQAVGGRRAPNGFIDRSLPHFRRNENIPAAKGFVANSFYSGLTATEFFFHTMAGREGLVDTAVKTADTGYMSRRLMKSMEDLSVQYDHTVRGATSNIIQFSYGDDSMDPSLMEDKNGKPINFDRVLSRVQATCRPEGDYLSPSDIEKTALWFQVTIPDNAQRVINPPDIPKGESYHHEKVGCSAVFCNALHSFLTKHADKLRMTRKRLGLREDVFEENDFRDKLAEKIAGITKKQLQVFIRICISRYHDKHVEPGTAIGAIGAQSIGEPGTQMTLKTFHFAGLASMNITQGVPRIIEIINASKNIRTPIITAILEQKDDKEVALRVKHRIEKITLSEISKKIELEQTLVNTGIVIKLDEELIRKAHLNITGHSVEHAILQTLKMSKIKLQSKGVSDYKLKIIPVPDPDCKISLHSALNTLKNRMPSVVVQGIKSCPRVIINRIEKKSEEKDPGYELIVEGQGFLQVMGTEGVIGTKTETNDIIEISKVLGIEAARSCIIKQIHDVMSNHGMSIDRRHMMLLADLMTTKGEVLGITRYGIQKMKDSVLMLASFEKTAELLFNASINGRVDPIDGVTECVVMGIPMRLGTGMLKVGQRQHIPELKYAPEPLMA